MDKINPLPHVRPRFKIVTPKTEAEIAQSFRDQLARSSSGCTASINPGFISLFIPATEQHYWSPQLNMTIESTEEGQVIRGLYGPRPTIWTMFVFFYFIIGLLLVFISIIGFSNRSLGLEASILWWVPVLLLLFLSLYAVSRFGERLGREQLHTLSTLAEAALAQELETEIHH